MRKQMGILPGRFWVGWAWLMSFAVLVGCASGRDVVADGDWCAHAPQGRPARFLVGTVSTGRFEHGPVAVSPDTREIFWSSHFPDDPLSRILTVRMTEKGWSEPKAAPFSLPYNSGEPFFIGPSSILFRSDRPAPGSGEIVRTYWTVERTDAGWGEPAPLGAPFLGVSWQSSMTRDGAIYFVMDENARDDDFGKDDLYRSRRVNGTYEEPENLGPRINTPYYDWGPFIFPDESALLFASTRPGGRGSSDLYVCFREPDGAWTLPRNLGRPVNTARHENWPSLSPDGRCLFFVRSRGGDADVYWVDASFLEELREEELEQFTDGIAQTR